MALGMDLRSTAHLGIIAKNALSSLYHHNKQAAEKERIEPETTKYPDQWVDRWTRVGGRKQFYHSYEKNRRGNKEGLDINIFSSTVLLRILYEKKVRFKKSTLLKALHVIWFHFSRHRYVIWLIISNRRFFAHIKFQLWLTFVW